MTTNFPNAIAGDAADEDRVNVHARHRTIASENGVPTLRQKPPSDADIRAALHRKLRADYASEPDTLIIDEFSVCQGDARADIAVVNGKLLGYEIKSERDTLNRLSRQRREYGKCFDRITIVVGPKHVAKAVHCLPQWWGITVATSSDAGVVFAERKPAEPNPSIDVRSVVKLLWKAEALAVLREHGDCRMSERNTCSEIWRRIVDTLSPRKLRAAVRDKIKARGDWRVGESPFPRGGSRQSSAMSQNFLAYRQWLLSHGSSCRRS